jgi:aryl-alcohol dehydrogenase-like predicted oxidoreductase
MQKRKVGSQGLEVGAIGLGCMGMTHAYGMGDEAESIATIHRAIELGVTMFDTAEVYGPHTNEVLLGKAIRGRRDQVVIATKFGFIMGSGAQRLDGSPANAKRAAEGCLSRLGIDVIDLYYLHRKDPDVPIEDTVGAMKELVDEGKVRYIGLSEVGVETIRRAHKVHPI